MTCKRAYGLAAAAWLSCALSAAWASPLADEAPAALLVEVRVNGSPAGTLAALTAGPAGCDLIETAVLRDAGLYDGAETEVCLSDLADLDYQLDREAARVEIFSGRLAPDRARRMAPRVAFAPERAGLIGQYGFSAQRASGPAGVYETGFADLSLTLHTRHGRVLTDQIAAWNGESASVQRLATVYERDFPENMTRFALGDSFTRAPRWGRISAFAGLQFGTDFSMDPSESWRPYKTFQALLRHQSEIDVRVNGSVRRRETALPGPNAIAFVPDAGLNEVEIAIRDASGLTRIEDVSFFASPDALAEGVTDFAFSLGVPRRFDGERPAYGDVLLASGLVRRGMSGSVTAEAYSEVSEAVWTAGGGAQLNAGPIGILNISAGISETRADGRGHVLSAGLDRSTRRTSLQVQARVADTAYADAASFAGAEFPDVSLRAAGGIFTAAGSFRASYSEQRDRLLADRRFLSLGWDKGFNGNRTTLSASGFRVIESGEIGCSISLRMSFGRYSVRSGLDRIGGLDLAAVEVARMRQDAERLQWSLRSVTGGGADAVQGELQADLGAADLFARAGRIAGTTEVSGGVRGVFTAMASHLVLSRETAPASVLVHVPGLAGVEIYKDNQPIAVTDAAGDALIAGVRPFEVNRLSLRPEDVPMSHAVNVFDLEFVPRRGIAEVTFEVRRETSLAFTVILPDGAPLPPGSRVTLAASGEVCPAGLDGRVYCAAADDSDTVIAETPQGRFSQLVQTLRQTGIMRADDAAELRLAGIS